jgi:hypothetical protein
MNKTQLSRWKRFSDGLAAKAYPHLTRARRKRLRAEIAEFIDILTCNYELSRITDWDGNGGSVHVCDELSRFLLDRNYELERHGESVTGRFGLMLSACIRAGFDVAVAPSAGVLGFTVGDLRAIFPRGLPQWVQGFFEKPISGRTRASTGVWL